MVAKRTLVIGGLGFIGKHLVPALVEAGHEVTVQDVLPIDTAKKQLHKDVKYVWKSMLDLNEKDLINIDNVAFLAAVADVPFAIASPSWTIYQNLLGVTQCLEVARYMKNPPKILIMSSESVYGKVQLDHLPIQETEALNPANVYGVSKAACDMLARTYANSFDLPIVVFRSTSLYGEQSRSQQVIPLFINQALREQNITIDGDGSQTRDFNYVGNMVHAIKLLFDSDITSGVFNIGSGADVDLQELTKMIIRLTGSKSQIEYREWRPGEKGIKLFVSLDRAKQILHYEPKFTFEEGMKRTIEYWRGVK